MCVCACHCVYFRRLRLREVRVGFIIQYEFSPVLYSVQSFNELDTAQHGYRLNTPSQLRDTCLLDHGIVNHMTISRLQSTTVTPASRLQTCINFTMLYHIAQTSAQNSKHTNC